jgi:exoribonuclease-2
MFKDNALLQGLQKEFKKDEKRVTGKVRYTQKSFGFLITEDNESYFIPPFELKKVLPDDIVEAVVKKGKEDKEFVEIDKLIEKGTIEFIGKIEKRNNNFFLMPDNMNISMFVLPNPKLKDGDWITAKLKRHPLNEGKLAVNLLSVIANNEDKRLFWKLAIEKNQINNEVYTLDINKEDLVLSEYPRKDLREKSFFTVDGYAKTSQMAQKDKRDRDDAVCVERAELGYKLYVAISDVAEFVKEGSALDQFAKKNTISYYFPDQTIPMLPKELSENHLSLNESVDRPVVVCEMDLDNNGEVVNYNFYEALINSNAQLSYNLVSDYIDSGVEQYYSDLEKDIILFAELGKLRNEWRTENQNVFENRKEYQLFLEDSKIIDIKELDNLKSALYIEEFMLSANISFAKYMDENNAEAIYNDFSGYMKEKKPEVLGLIDLFNIDIEQEEIFTFSGFQKIKEQLKDKEDYISDLFNMCMSKAKLSLSAVPHAGLGIESGYATFTSPLRKYIDLINHRNLKAVIRNNELVNINSDLLLSLKENQLKQRKAENFIKNNLHYVYMSDKLNEEFNGKVIGVFPRGVSLKLEENGIMGFLPIDSFGKEVTEYNEVERKIIFNDDTTIKLSDIIEVSLKDVNIKKRDIIFKLKK